MKIDQFNFAGKKAIVRVDFNVPLDENGNVTDDTRIRGALPTLKKVLADGGALIMMSHMGKPKGKVKPELSLGQIVKNVSAALGVEVKFAPDCGNASEAAAALQPGEALLLENLRFYPEEEGKPVGVEKGTPEFDEAKKEMKVRQKEFAKKLASYADVYVNDAFGTAHRKHASTAVIADYFDADSKMLGYLMEKEVTAIDNVLKNAQHPFTAIIGGSKVSSKLGVIKNLLDKVDNLIIGGGMAYTFLKAKGYEIGKSLVDDTKIDYCKEMMEKAEKLGKKLLLPVDSVMISDFPNPIDDPTIETEICDADKMNADKEGCDIGPKTIKLYSEAVKTAKTVVWNGPMGVFENPVLAAGTKAVAAALAETDATTIIGGGDSAAAVNILGYGPKMSHISTGGGASLEFLEGKELPGVVAANDK